MTTIAYRSGVLAFDSQVTSSSTVYGTVIKGKKTKRFLLAAAGSCEDCDAWLDWMTDTGGDLKAKKDYGLDKDCEMEGIAVDRKGNVSFYESKCYPFTVDGRYHALGSGSAFAMGAMAFGATAKQAVQVSTQLDPYTGGTIRTLKW